MNDKLKTAAMNELFEAILTLDNMEECYKFFEDLCTIPELLAMQQRLQVAKMLNEHQIYNNIVKNTGASTATISRVNKCLEYGEGYRMIFDRISLKKYDSHDR